MSWWQIALLVVGGLIVLSFLGWCLESAVTDVIADGIRKEKERKP